MHHLYHIFTSLRQTCLLLDNFDTILRLAASESLYDAADAGYLTQYVENKFNYVQDPVSTGYFNTAAYILKYGENLEEIVVELPVESSESSYLKN